MGHYSGPASNAGEVMMHETEQGGSPLAATGRETGSLIPGNPTGRFLSHAETDERPAA
jgi:hypothetical protein